MEASSSKTLDASMGDSAAPVADEYRPPVPACDNAMQCVGELCHIIPSDHALGLTMK